MLSKVIKNMYYIKAGCFSQLAKLFSLEFLYDILKNPT